jgi:hypothetical protein
MTRPTRLLAAAIAAAVAGSIAGTVSAQAPQAPPDAAAGCLAAVEALAARTGVEADPPTAAPRPGASVTSRELARSGGVIEPPATGASRVIEPPPGAAAPMPTLPRLGERAAPPAAAEAAADARLRATLTAARAAAERGDGAACAERLAEARRHLGR